MDTLFIWLLTYFLGSIPFGVLFARAKNINLREQGSGNIGATNVARILGKKMGALTLLGDVSKGWVSVFIASRVLETPFEIAMAGLTAFLGHLYSIFLKFKGGKGVAVGLGIFLFLMPLATLSSIFVFAVTLWIGKYVSLASITASTFLPLFGLFYRMPLPPLFLAVVVALLILNKHHENIRRIMEGTEAQFLKK